MHTTIAANKPHYMPQLDSLRAISVLAVLVQHWYGGRFPIGSWGVTVFFVISGYLITQSILRLRDTGLSVPTAALDFFAKRSPRLFPAYYLVLAVGTARYPELRADWPWYAFYLSNYLLDIRQAFSTYTPTWSLAVEEQFYLV